MEVSVENTGSLGRRMTVAVPADRVEQAFASRLKRLSQQVKVPGFRPGKTPMKVVEARYGGRVMEEITGELIESTFREAVGQKGLKPVAGPLIQRKSAERGKEFAYTAEFEVYPEITRLDLKGETIERPTCAITAADVDRSVQSLRDQRATWEPVEREAREGDRLTIDFTGSIDSEPFEGGTASDLDVVLGAGALMQGFEDGLLGAKSGETRVLDLPFSTEHPKPELAGKSVKFDITVKKVAGPVPPEVNEDFARNFGVEDGSVDTLRERVRVNLEREMGQRVRSVLRTRVLEVLVSANTFELPTTLLKAETEFVRRLHRSMRNPQRHADEETDEESTAYDQAARRRLARSLVLAEVIRANDLRADPDKVRARIAEMAQGYESPEEFIRACYATPARLSEVEAEVVEEQALEHLLDTADVTDKPMSFQELVKTQGAAS